MLSIKRRDYIAAMMYLVHQMLSVTVTVVAASKIQFLELK